MHGDESNNAETDEHSTPATENTHDIVQETELRRPPRPLHSKRVRPIKHEKNNQGNAQ